jgi:hypothetical protein
MNSSSRESTLKSSNSVGNLSNINQMQFTFKANNNSSNLNNNGSQIQFNNRFDNPREKIRVINFIIDQQEVWGEQYKV